MKQFTAGELEIMKILWEHGELKPAQIQAHYPRPIKNAALRFQLKILLEKQHVQRQMKGKAYFYRAATPRKGAFKRMVQRMADVYCQGSCAGLVAELLKTQRFSQAEIQELMQLAEAKHRGVPKGQSGGKKS